MEGASVDVRARTHRYGQRNEETWCFLVPGVLNDERTERNYFDKLDGSHRAALAAGRQGRRRQHLSGSGVRRPSEIITFIDSEKRKKGKKSLRATAR